MFAMSVTLDVSKHSGWLNDDACCRVKGTGYTAVRGASREAVGRETEAAQAACTGMTRLKEGFGPQGMRGAHPEHEAHVRDAGRVPAQRLVERPRGLPRVERTACDAGRGADREAGDGGRPRCTQRAGEGSTADWEQGMGRSARRTCRPCL